MRPRSPRMTTARLAPLALLLALAAVGSARADDETDPPGRVARVNLVAGAVSLEPAGSENWVTDVLNRPLTNGDRLWADRDARAELHVGSTAMRLGSETGIAILNIDDRSIQLRLSAGVLELRVRGLGAEQTFEVATPSASVSLLRPGDYRIEVADGGGLARIAVARGQVAVTDQGHEASVDEGQLAEYDGGGVDQARISPLPAGDAFDQWVAERDRHEDHTVSPQYVSHEVTGYEDLDDYGSWQNGDEYGPVWVPVVAVGWAPYRYGHWGWIGPWGWTWIDDAPWGFAPFHYGRWVFFHGNWCWAPGPRRYAPVYAPALVGWVGGAHWSAGVAVGGPPVGWFPLGWNEVYVPAYRVSTNYVRNVNVTNIHVTNTVINTYITNNTTIVNGRRTVGEGDLAGRRYANYAVPGAVTATTQAAFTGAQPVATHPAKLPREVLERGPVGTGAPAIAPTASSLGRPAATAPRAAPGLWNRPVVARTLPPAPPPSFEAQRHAVEANGGLPVPVRGSGAPTGTAPGAAQAGAPRRADVIQVQPRGAARPAPSQAAAPGVAGRPAAPPARPVDHGPAPQNATRPREEPSGERGAAPPAPATRPAPDYRPPPHDKAPQPAPRATPEYRAPTVPHEPQPAPPPRTTPEYRAPAPARESTPPPASRPQPEYHPPAPAREVAPAPRPAPEYRPPAPVHEAAPPPAPREAPPPPPAPREAPPARESHPPPPPAPHADRSAKPEHDRR